MKPPAFPFTPKSTAFLKPGTFWDMRREDGAYAVGVVLQLNPAANAARGRMFLAGVLDVVTDDVPRAEDLRYARLVDQGFAHLKVITENGGMVRGIIDLDALGVRPKLARNMGFVLQARVVFGYYPAEAEKGRSVADYPILSTWGYRVPLIIAQKLPRKTKNE